MDGIMTNEPVEETTELHGKKLVSHAPEWIPAAVYDPRVEDGYSSGYLCIHVLENGAGQCGREEYDITRQIASVPHKCIVRFADSVDLPVGSVAVYVGDKPAKCEFCDQTHKTIAVKTHRGWQEAGYQGALQRVPWIDEGKYKLL